MPHLTEDAMERYAERRLSPLERGAVEHHVLECEQCLNALMVASLAMRVKQRIYDAFFSKEAEMELADAEVLP